MYRYNAPDGCRVFRKKGADMEFNVKDLQWVRQPKEFIIDENRIEITTEPDTDLWQRQ